MGNFLGGGGNDEECPFWPEPSSFTPFWPCLVRMQRVVIGLNFRLELLEFFRRYWPPVLRLHFFRCPSAVSRPAVEDALLAMTARIISVHVDAVERFVGRTAAHVREEIGKTVFAVLPAIAHADPTAAIVLIRGRVGIVAALASCLPGSVLALANRLSAVNEVRGSLAAPPVSPTLATNRAAIH